MRATSSNGRAHGRPSRALPAAPCAKSCCANSGWKSDRTSPNWGASSRIPHPPSRIPSTTSPTKVPFGVAGGLRGIVEVVALGMPVGLGSHVSWDRKLDGRLAQALMSIPAVKGVELGLGFEAARRKGSEVHDEILPGFARATNRAGGTEGGMTTGEPLVLRVAMKPISTLMSPLRTVDLASGAVAQAQSERSDVTAVPAMGVIAEAMVAIVLTEALLEKFGGDALSELKRNVDGYLAQVRARTPKGAAS